MLYIALVCLLGSSILTALSTALHRKGKLQTEEHLKQPFSLFFFCHLLRFFFGKHTWEGLLFALSFTKHLLRVAFVILALLSCFNEGPYLIGIALIILISSLCFDFLFRLLGQRKPHLAFRLLFPLGSCLLFVCLPITAIFFLIMRHFLSKASSDKALLPTFKIRDKVYELLQETELGTYLDATEQKFILSVVSFKERIAREVMVPRINLFSMPEDLPLEKAAEEFLKEGYSRIPVYKESVDNIIGVLLYKDVLQFYIHHQEAAQQLKMQIATLVKPVLYTPETKKISQLLQEFRSKQIHMAIVVDEWGGTEGVVTIEDILEELVGEIGDEYDVGQQTLFSPLPNGSWIVDAKMSIIDIQEELGVDIPKSPEYDTIGGYVFHKAGSIPPKGWKIHHDAFDLEVLSSTERAVDKIKMTSLEP